jgi:sterol desaturase/sphingolipid hydroxylase (fatty acid hydroxylase superfamily)
VLRRGAPYALFPALLTLGLGLSAWAIARGAGHVLVLNVATGAMFVVVFCLERLMPYRGDWRRDDQQLNDVGHAVFSGVVAGVAGNAIVQMTYALFDVARGSGVRGLGAQGWPLGVEILLTHVIIDFGRYFHHRAMHRYRWLWRIHALHHSGERLSVLKTQRAHALERLMQLLYTYAVLAALGSSRNAVFWILLPNALLAFLIHSNIDMKTGSLEWIIVGPRTHRLHHSADMGEAMHNFGSVITLWDVLFGTALTPFSRQCPETVGIAGDATPRGFIAQILLR